MLPDFDRHLQTYAEILLKIGLNLRAGQRLLITAVRTDGVPIEAAPLVREVVRQAYQMGSPFVEVIWGDEAVRLARFRYAPADSFAYYSSWHSEALREHTNRGDAVLNVTADNPTLLEGIDPHRLATARRAVLEHMAPYFQNVTRNVMNWLVAAAAVTGWAEKVFPDLRGEAAVDRLWDAIFQACRVYEPEPLAAWQRHIAGLKARGAYLNARRYDALRFRGPGTDLTVGLAEGHMWQGAQNTAANGVTYTANIPTEEVFTAPHARRVEGVVRATMPLNFGGVLIADFSLEFEGGRVVALRAGQNEDALRRLVETDEGAARLGEVALVPHSSPIARSGLLFYNTLFDENAASHIALGRAYRDCIAGGEKMSDEAFAAAGGNDSLEHVDFMIGSGEMDVDGLRNGVSEPVMRGGEWAFVV
ncbi:MAG: aminopeptidase [Caldilineales bacterium]|nr:aminopeptidase [Caldilineales bacterium]MCX7851580.1 aminopeptidase [Caldilineales bacterium]